MWAKIITIKITKDLNYFSLCALNLFNTRVSQFELNYWNKWTFPWHSNLSRWTCITWTIKSLFLNTASGWKKFLKKTAIIKNRLQIDLLSFVFQANSSLPVENQNLIELSACKGVQGFWGWIHVWILGDIFKTNHLESCITLVLV